MMKNIIIYISVLIIGVIIGKFAFSSSSETGDHSHGEMQKQEHWTCPMHPQIDMPKKGKCPLCGMDLVLKMGGGNKEGGMKHQNMVQMTETAMHLANIETTTVKKSAYDISTDKIIFSGKIRSDETKEKVISTHYAGRIEKLYINFIGQKVSKGQLIAELYSPELVLAQKELIQSLKSKKTEPELYRSVVEKLKNWKITDNQIKGIEETGKIIENFKIYSTEAGFVEEQKVVLGDHIKRGDIIVKLVNLNKVWGILDVYERNINQIKKGDKISINTIAYPGREYVGVVTYIYPTVDKVNHTIKVRVELNNRKYELKPGMIIKAKNNTMEGGDGELILLPKSSILWTGDRSVVYIKPDKDMPMFELREVTLGVETKDNYEIVAGLKEGDEIVTKGAFTIDATAELQGKKSMMNNSHVSHNISKSNDIELGEKEAQNFEELISTYIKIKDLFVDKKVEDIKKEIVVMKKQLNGEKFKTYSSILKNANNYKRDINKYLDIIKKESEESKQHKAFKSLSETLARIVETLGTREDIYFQFCPMANNNTGGYWLSYEKDIKNPYLGNSMLNCGTTKKEFLKK